MSDRIVVCLALAVMGGALTPTDLPVEVAVGGSVVALLVKQRILIVFTLALLASSLSGHAWHQLRQPLPQHSVQGDAVLVDDPAPLPHGGIKAEVRYGHRHVEIYAYGTAGKALQPLAAGQHIAVEGNPRLLTGRSAPSLRRRHIAYSITVHSVASLGHTDTVYVAPNALRQMLSDGAVSLDRQDRALLSGFVLGDDRNETETLKDDFSSSGLSHLLAVSGENVAFVLLVCAPLIKRASLAGRFVSGMAVLLMFGLTTRWEPSVIRAEAMAAIAMLAAFAGVPVTAARVLGLAVTGSVLIDPFLAGSVGFLLSVCACCGLVFLGPLITGLLPGPEWVRRALGYGAAAEIGVAPMQLAVFGSIPWVSLPANLLAGPVAGVLMVWGIVGGLIAGLLVAPASFLAAALHLPSALMLWWVRWVAHTAAHQPVRIWCVAFALVFLGVLVARYGRRGEHYDPTPGVSGEGRRSVARQPLGNESRS